MTDTLKAAATKVLDPTLSGDDYTSLVIVLAAIGFLALVLWLMRASYTAEA